MATNISISGMNWETEWNNIIRYVIFKDDLLKALMNLPTGTTILDFVDKYFIRAGYTSSVLTDEDVRIIYGDISSESTNNPNVLLQELSFDIYVKNECLRNATKDRLMLRTHLIATRIKTLLNSKNDNLGGYKFRCIGESDMGTSAVGYSRYNISFNYKKTI